VSGPVVPTKTALVAPSAAPAATRAQSLKGDSQRAVKLRGRETRFTIAPPATKA
jgi:hypothetical protein